MWWLSKKICGTLLLPVLSLTYALHWGNLSKLTAVKGSSSSCKICFAFMQKWHPVIEYTIILPFNNISCVNSDSAEPESWFVTCCVPTSYHDSTSVDCRGHGGMYGLCTLRLKHGRQHSTGPSGQGEGESLPGIRKWWRNTPFFLYLKRAFVKQTIKTLWSHNR